MKTTDFTQTMRAVCNTLELSMENSSEETWAEDIKKALAPFGEHVVSNLDHLTFG